jgi:REP element-mobilizing transposase RayT/DNA-binding NarL/FixJ family response regulator
MTNPLLIVTSDVSFGEFIRQSLEETGRFTVRVMDQGETAASYILDTGCSFVILDTSLQGEDVLALGRALRQIAPLVQFVAISEAGWHLALEELAPLIYLSKPVFFPDLLDTVDKAFPVLKPSIETNQLETSPENSELPWLSDVSRAAQHLTRLTLESSAQAALITRDEQPWAYAGQLPQIATVEVADNLARYWGRQKENDLVRFVRLAATGAEHMLYATRLAPDTLLALIFDAETPFSTIRVQASRLVHSLSASPEAPKAAAPALVTDETDADAPTPSISKILSDVPEPNPSGDIFSAAAERMKKPAPAIQWPRLQRQKQETVPVDSLQPPETEEKTADSEKTLTSLEQTVPSAAITRKTKPRRNEIFTEEANETRPSAIGEVARKIVLEPVSPAVYNLDYACLLLPRFAHHHLTGDLSERLGDLVPQFCVAFGWRLEYISIRPEYLQWIVNVSPSTSPAYLMRSLRQQTSERIFAEFPRFKKENPSGDFWAPGYLIMGGSQPPPAQLIKDFINQTRQRQGLAPQFHP